MSELSGYAFKYDCKCAGLLNGMGVFKESLATTGLTIVGTTLHAVTTHAVIALRCKPDVPHDGDVDTTDC